MTLRYLAWRLFQVLPTAVGIVLVAFTLLHLAPGDPILALAGEHGDAAYYDFMRERFGLDRSLPEQLMTFMRRAVAGDVGVSYVHGRPAMAVITERIPATLGLMLTALILSTGSGILVGAYGGARAGRRRDLVLTIGTLLLAAAPVFLVGQLAVLGPGIHLGLFPLGGMRSAGSELTGLAAALDLMRHLALPALVLAAAEIAVVARLTRRALASELASDHVRTARAKGLGRGVVLVRHGMRAVALPILTVVGGRVGHVLGGAVVVEILFGWPGIGRLLLAATQTRDTPVLVGIFLLIAATVVTVNLLTDLLYAALDPRIRFR